MISKKVPSTIFKVFGMTRPGIEPRSPGPLYPLCCETNYPHKTYKQVDSYNLFSIFSLSWHILYYLDLIPERVYGFSYSLIWFTIPDLFLSPMDIIIIIMSCRQHGYSWLSVTTPPFHSSLLARPQGYIPYPHRAAVCRFELFSLSHMRGSIGVHHLWARPCFSSSVLHVWFV